MSHPNCALPPKLTDPHGTTSTKQLQARTTQPDKKKRERRKDAKREMTAPAANRTRGPSMATMDFTTKPLAPCGVDEII
ncbi:hypothetical protein QBC45DRAFT_318115 [Copromyces sp. CBS 386.78]|nr:hypothetical protein QBC45DRAFT_318115 [Copromyces sp. CBS 386.78]